MSNRWREWVEAHLPWYSPHDERSRNARTEAIRVRSEAARDAAKAQRERIIAEYRRAARAAGVAGEAVIDEVRRDDK